MKNIPALLRALAALAAVTLLASGAAAQTVAKPMNIEVEPAFTSFTQWVHTTVVHVAVPAAPSVVQTLSLQPPATAQATAYEPQPLILGQPELPLMGTARSPGSGRWSSGFNYQGMHTTLLVLDPGGTRLEARSLASRIRPGERFKLRVTPTFRAVAELDQVVGDAWYGQRTGQAYPRPGLSVQMNAGEVVDLPLGANEYFVMNGSANERLVLSVRHAKALREARSNQPVYRQDAAGGSSYLQLVPAGRYPALEQLISLAQ